MPIGMGGMGEVYRARDAELGRVVAVKVLAERLAGQEEFRRRFRREAVSAARIAHRHVATVYDVGEHAGRPYLVMEHLPGGALSDRIAGRPAREEAIAWVEQTAGALDAAHARGVVHRDIKPANLLLDASGDVKVADFGIARVLEGGGSTVTAAGTVLGTAGYNAGRSLIDLGRCREAVPFLQASAGTGSESQNEIRQAALEEARECADGDRGGREDEDDERDEDGEEAKRRGADEARGGRGAREPRSVEQAIALTDRSTASMRGGNPTEALGLAALALERLAGTGHRYEGNASYNAGRSLIDLGRCGDAVPLLERSLEVGGATERERRIRREALAHARRCG